MPKKQKRQVSRSAAPIVRETAASITGSAAQAPAPRSTSAARSSIVEFNPDYSYVVSDLKRIGILAGSFITILVVLSFFLR